MKIQFLGQNCFLIRIGNRNYLTDPFYNFKKEESLFDLKKQEINGIFVTHAHGDHTADVKETLSAWPDVLLVAQPEICGYFEPKNMADLNIGGTWNGTDISVSMVSARHTSSFPDGTYGGEASGFVFKTKDKTVYMSGDTALTADMGLLTLMHQKIDVAILCIGGHYTMDAKQAVLAAEMMGTKHVIGCHFDTFPPITIDHEKTIELFNDNKIKLQLPKIGEWIEL